MDRLAPFELPIGNEGSFKTLYLLSLPPFDPFLIASVRSANSDDDFYTASASKRSTTPSSNGRARTVRFLSVNRV